MIADWVLTGDDFAFLADNLTSWLAYGIGLGCVLWLIGRVVGFVLRFVRY